VAVHYICARESVGYAKNTSLPDGADKVIASYGTAASFVYTDQRYQNVTSRA